MLQLQGAGAKMSAQGSAVAVHLAEEGANNILTAVQNAQATETWKEMSMQGILLGDSQAELQAVWRLDELHRFEGYRLPCWVLRCVIILCCLHLLPFMCPACITGTL